MDRVIFIWIQRLWSWTTALSCFLFWPRIFEFICLFLWLLRTVLYCSLLGLVNTSFRSILWFPIPPLPDKTFWKFSDFHSENGLKSILTIIVMGNKQWFTLFCFQSWFPENEMLPDKTFWQRIQIYIICRWSTALWWCILLSTGLYSTIFNHKSRIRW